MESGGYERFSPLLKENHCVETINSSAPQPLRITFRILQDALIWFISNYQEMWSLPFCYEASSESLCGALTYGSWLIPATLTESHRRRSTLSSLLCAACIFYFFFIAHLKIKPPRCFSWTQYWLIDNLVPPASNWIVKHSPDPRSIQVVIVCGEVRVHRFNALHPVVYHLAAIGSSRSRSVSPRASWRVAARGFRSLAADWPSEAAT